MNLKHSKEYQKTVYSKYMVGSSAAPYCNIKYPTHLVIVDARTQHRLIDQLFSVPKCVRLLRMSEKSIELLTASSNELISEFQRKKAKGMMSSEFPTVDEKDETHQTMTEIEPLLIASGYRTWRHILLNHGEYPYHYLAHTFWYPKRANLVLVWDAEELFTMGLPDQAQNVTILLVSAMLAVRWPEVTERTTEQEMAAPAPEQLSRVNLTKRLDLIRTTCRVLRIPKAIERIWARCRLMPWFRVVITAWVYECAKRDMSQNTEAYQSFQLDIGAGFYKREFLTHRNPVTTVVKKSSWDVLQQRTRE